jgi:hypothetical protein
MMEVRSIEKMFGQTLVRLLEYNLVEIVHVRKEEEQPTGNRLG